jgi:hypothetical protein
MKNKKIKNLTYITLLISGLAFISFGFLSDDKSGQKPIRPSYKQSSVQESGKQGDAYRLFVNNINLPMNRTGVIADVDIPPNGTLGRFKGENSFLWSSGFFLSGYSDGQLWANAVATASLVEDYRTGQVNPGPNDDSQMYVLNSQDPAFGPSWQDWIDAVALGADFYDGDGDGVYIPVDKNLNGEWDPDEDRPDLIGDETVWCVYHDGLPQAQRRWNTVPPYGIEIRQTAFAFASAGAIGNLIFIRYRFKYVGLGNPNEADEMTDVYFGVWADPDNGDHTQDVVGSDINRDVGFTYDNQTDDQWGNQPPCFMIDFFSGPRAYVAGETYTDMNGNGEYDEGIDIPIDTAYSVRGQVMGVKEFPGARNEGVSSFVLYINGDPNLEDPENKEEARNYIQGLEKLGTVPDPCTFAYGAVLGGVDCNTVDPRFWFSGDPVTNTGWICTINEDVRQMTNTGPFVLKKNEENEIVVAYVVGQGTTPLNSVTVARAIDDGAQNIFDLNFLAPSPPPPVQPTLTTGDNFIDIVWETPDQIAYANQTPSWDLFFHQYQVWAFQTNSTADLVSGVQNSQLLTTYQIQNFITDVYTEDAESGGIFLLYPESSVENKLDSAIYADPETGRIRYRIFIDPFTNTPITKGKPYYFSVISSALNSPALIPYERGDSGSYYLDANAFVQATESIKTINSIVAGVDVYNPPILVQSVNRIGGFSLGNVGYDVQFNNELTNDTYEVTFFKDSSSSEYQMFWKLDNITRGGPPLVDSSLSYTWGSSSVDEIVTDGFITRVEDQTAEFENNPTYIPAGNIWYAPFPISNTYYLGRDLPGESSTIPTFPGTCEYIKADRLRTVEIRFNTNSGKAYRYITCYTGLFGGLTSYPYAAEITPADTVGKGPIGNWDTVNDRPNGFVDVPFTAWVVDENYGIEQQLAVGFVERARKSSFPNGTPDGVWDPTDSLLASGEIIIVFDAPYDPTGSQIQYTGGDFTTSTGTETVWADLVKASNTAKPMPEDAQGVTEEQRAIFNSPWFNTMYAYGAQRIDSTIFYTDGDVAITEMLEYPYTEESVYEFNPNGSTISSSEEQDLWSRVNVFPNPLFGFNENTGYVNQPPDDPWVTFSNLPPTDITIRIYSLSGTLVRTLTQDDRDEVNSPYIRWDLHNDADLRVGSGMYLAIVSSPQYGDKVLKLAIIMPQKQIQRF